MPHSAVCSVTACLPRGEVTYEFIFCSSIFVSLSTRALAIGAVLLLISEAYIKLCGQDEVVIRKDKYELNVSVFASVDKLIRHKHCLSCL